MAVTSFAILANGTWGPKIAPDGTRTYQVTLEAFTDVQMSGGQVIGAGGMPIKYGTHADDAQAICTSVDAEQDPDDHLYWILTYHYTTKPDILAQAAYDAGGGLTGEGETSPERDDDNPLNNPPDIKLRTKRYKRLILQDLDGVLIANRAGDPYEGTHIEVPRLVIDITRNLASFDPELIVETVGGVNVSTVWGYEPRQMFCEELTADPVRQQNMSFWKIHGLFVVAQEDDLLVGSGSIAGSYWYEWKLNAGYYSLVSGVRTSINIGPHRTARPQLLTSAGALAAVGATPYFLGFRVFPDAPFHSLGLFD